MRTIDLNIMTVLVRVLMDIKPRTIRSLYNIITSDKYLNRSISGSTLHKHLTTLRLLGYLDHHGLKLTTSTEEKFRMDRLEFPIFHPRNPQKKMASRTDTPYGAKVNKRNMKKKKNVMKYFEDTDKVRRNDKILVMILAQAVFGSGRNIESKIVRRGDVIIKGKEYYYDRLPGTGVSDFFIDLKNIDMGSIFNDIQTCCTRVEVEKSFQILQNYHIIKEVQINQDNRCSTGESRWIVLDESLAEVIREIILIFSEVSVRMRLWWNNVKRPGRKSGEREWYEIMYGQMVTDIQFGKYFAKDRSEYMNTKQVKKLIQGVHPINPTTLDRIIRSYDSSIILRYKRLRAKHVDTIKKHHIFLDFLLDRICYPKFLQDMHKNDTKS